MQRIASSAAAAALAIALHAGLPGALTAQGAPVQAAAAQSAPAQAPTPAALFERADLAWDAGRYDEALADLKSLLSSPAAAEYHDRIAELTGEIWVTAEVAKDARMPRWAPDSRHLGYEKGAVNSTTVHVVSAAAGFPSVISESGRSLVFSPDGARAAWITSASDGKARIVVAQLGARAREEIAVDAAAVASLAILGGSVPRIVAVAGNPGDTTAALIVRDLTGSNRVWRTVSTGRPQPVSLLTSQDGSRLLVTLGERGAFARAIPGFTAAARAYAFAELSGETLGGQTPGIFPTFSADAGTVAWLVPAVGGLEIKTQKRGGEIKTAAKGANIQNPALSPDGSTVAYSEMFREDWEIFTAPSDGSADPSRLTREIQHDLFPQYVSPSQLLAVMGEGRHRRSYLYDVSTGARTRLFHNNSVRTVAPEYEWAVSPDGSRVAIVAERDGDTVTPHRHLYMMDLNTKVSRESLAARVDSNLTAELGLRERGRRMFAPIEADVRAATEAVNLTRIYRYQRDLFAFDSKHITQPGNWKATDYLLEKYRSFGLEAHLQRFMTVAGSEIEVANVVAVVPGTVDPDLIYVVGAHFDSRAEGPGADDNTSGTSMILEAARVLSTRPQRATVMFVSFTGEESGLRGAREFARRMKDSIKVAGALNNDMMGWSNDHRLDNTIRYSNPGLRDVQHAAAIQFSNLITYDAYYYKSTDAHALYDAWGDIIAGIGSHPILGNPHYHQSHDVLETINHRQLQETSRTTVATIMLMASSPKRLDSVEATGTRASWSPAVESRITGYVVRWGPPEDPMRHSANVTTTSATLTGARAGWHVAVKAVNDIGLEGWDWAKAVVR